MIVLDDDKILNVSTVNNLGELTDHEFIALHSVSSYLSSGTPY